jgi:hypothetical protein
LLQKKDAQIKACAESEEKPLIEKPPASYFPQSITKPMEWRLRPCNQECVQTHLILSPHAVGEACLD